MGPIVWIKEPDGDLLVSIFLRHFGPLAPVLESGDCEVTIFAKPIEAAHEPEPEAEVDADPVPSDVARLYKMHEELAGVVSSILRRLDEHEGSAVMEGATCD
jgi:hypothetical protein